MLDEIERVIVSAEWATGRSVNHGDEQAASAPGNLRPVLSIVVPTRNEAGNIGELVQRIEAALPERPLEIVFVDDSDDDTPAAIRAVGAESPLTVRLLHRAAGERSDGLGGAVIEGLRVACAEMVIVMDADLQHPPELLPSLVGRASQTGADVVVASRYSDSGSVGDFSVMRKAVSTLFGTAAHAMFPQRLKQVSDPMSGYFLVRKAALDLNRLQPHGFKILLEILVRTPGLRVAEVGFEFGERFAGESKASLREGARYVSHLWRLRFGEQPLRFARFLATGASGLVVNSLLLALVTQIFGLQYLLLSALIATQGSSLWNFTLSEWWVFRATQQPEGRLTRLTAFLVMNNVALALRGPILYGLTAMLGVHYLVANLISLLVLTLVRYALANRWIWKPGQAPAEAIQSGVEAYRYDIHGIISVTSQVALPELTPFRTQSEITSPTIRVRLGSVERAAGQETPGGPRHIHYTEGLGIMGFGMDMVFGKTPDDTIEVLASPILRYSPHVLYTNIVEPILRWTFVRKGYALVHGACMAFGDKAFMVTARTDTGKTTTMLRVLAEPRPGSAVGAFISDDLTLVSPDGRVLTYPKPMTISHHTVKAINASALHWHERLALMIQSRVHSRDGRRFAMWLTQHRLPVATINTYMQLIVPPPKYPVQRLIPGVRSARTAQLAGLFVIQRGGAGSVNLGSCEALDILMKNCDDAYGFPPYHTIAESLYCPDGNNLRLREREIVNEALGGSWARLLRSSNMDWSDRIQTAVTGEPAGQASLPVLQGCGEMGAEPVPA